MKTRKMTTEEKSEAFLKMHPEYPKFFNSPEDEKKYLINMLKEGEREIDELNSRLEKMLDEIELMENLSKPVSKN